MCRDSWTLQRQGVSCIRFDQGFQEEATLLHQEEGSRTAKLLASSCSSQDCVRLALQQKECVVIEANTSKSQSLDRFENTNPHCHSHSQEPVSAQLQKNQASLTVRQLGEVLSSEAPIRETNVQSLQWRKACHQHWWVVDTTDRLP